MNEQASSISFDTAQQWSATLQRRIIRLLLLDHNNLYREKISQFIDQSNHPARSIFEHVDHYMRLVTLSDELLEDIVPRIRRQLSLQTDHERLREEGPTRGDIDWNRTIDRTVRETPNQFPIEFDTIIRRQSTTTPENILTVAILQTYADQLQFRQTHDIPDAPLTSEEQAMLSSIEARVRRELAAPYAQELNEQATLDTDALDALITVVEARLRGPSAYRDLIVWWHRFQTLSISKGNDRTAHVLAPMRDDDHFDAALYELWIVLELAFLLKKTMRPPIITTDTLSWEFDWPQGAADSIERYQFSYNKQKDNEHWTDAPKTRPDYALSRTQPHEIHHPETNTIIWREPMVVWDAKYYLAGTDPTRTHAPIKKMLGDLLLLDVNHASLLFPLLPEPEQSHKTRTIQRTTTSYGKPGIREISVDLYRISPDMPLADLHARLTALLERSIAHLPPRQSIRCWGIMLDRDSVNDVGIQPEYDIACPKPHIGPDVVDLVRSTVHCLKDPYYCHVINRDTVVPPFVKRILTEAELTTTITALKDQLQTPVDDDSDAADQKRKRLINIIGELTETFIKTTHADTTAIEHALSSWILKGVWDTSPNGLSSAARAMLISGEYVWVHSKRASIKDWAAAVVQYVRALEHEMHRRFYQSCKAYLTKKDKKQWIPMEPKDFMFGKPGYIYNNHTSDPNWQVWLNHLVIPNGISEHDFIQLILDIDKLRYDRNTIAHKDSVDLVTAERVHDAVLGTPETKGLLLRLLTMLPAPPT